MTRLTLLLALGGAGLLLTPGAASAQFMRPFGAPFGSQFGIPPGAPVIVPSANPFFYVPRYSYTAGFSYVGPTLFGPTVISARRTFYGTTYPLAVAYAVNQYPTYAQGGSYMTGGSNVRPALAQAAQRELEIAQRVASQPGAKGAISQQWDYETRGPTAPPDAGAPPPPDPVRVAAAPADPALISSGEALNTLLKEINRLEATGAKGPAAYIPPLLLDDVRFGGSPAGDLLNLARQAGSLQFPAAFDDPALAASATELDKAFTAVAAAVQGGKSPEAARLAKLEQSFQKLQEAAAPVLKNLPFEEATAARRFLNQMASATKALKAGAGNGLIDPKWSGEGLTVSDLTRHMAKHKVLFAPAPRGGEEAYATMHQNLATYLFVLNQPKK